MWHLPSSVKAITLTHTPELLALSQAHQRTCSSSMPPVETNPTSSGSTPVNVKLLLIGNASVGKSSLLLRFSDEAWIPEDEATATIGVDFRVSVHRWTQD